MVNYDQTASVSANQINELFYSLSDPTRRDILERLAYHPLNVTEIAKDYDMSLPAVSKHIKILEQARLVKKEKKGREHTLYLQSKRLKTIADYLSFYEKFWSKQFDSLENYLENTT